MIDIAPLHIKAEMQPPNIVTKEPSVIISLDEEDRNTGEQSSTPHLHSWLSGWLC